MAQQQPAPHTIKMVGPLFKKRSHALLSSWMRETLIEYGWPTSGVVMPSGLSYRISRLPA